MNKEKGNNTRIEKISTYRIFYTPKTWRKIIMKGNKYISTLTWIAVSIFSHLIYSVFNSVISTAWNGDCGLPNTNFYYLCPIVFLCFFFFSNNEYWLGQQKQISDLTLIWLMRTVNLQQNQYELCNVKEKNMNMKVESPPTHTHMKSNKKYKIKKETKEWAQYKIRVIQRGWIGVQALAFFVILEFYGKLRLPEKSSSWFVVRKHNSFKNKT